MLSNNVQYWLQGSIEVLLRTNEKIVLNKGVYMDKELNALIRFELKSQMDDHDDVLRENELENVMKMAIILDELDNSDNLEDGRPSNTLSTYYVSSPEYFMHFEPVTPQYEELKNDKFNYLTLRITDQNGSIITKGPGTTVVLHI